MRTYSDLMLELGYLADVEQGSQEWMMMRLGVATASCAKEWMAGRSTATYQTYLADKVAEVCTGSFADQVSSKALQWGKDHEETARIAYEFQTVSVIKQIPFIYKDADRRFGCSPDGITDSAHGLELKCPFRSAVYIQFRCDEKIKPEYVEQCQYSMWVSGRDEWHFANYDPRMRINGLHYVSIKRNEQRMREYDARAEEWIKDMDLMLDKMGFKFGDQFTYI